MPLDPARRYLAALAADIAARAGADPTLAPFAERLAEARVDAPRPLPAPAAGLDTLAHLPAALAGADGVPALLGAVREMAAQLGWYQIYQGAGVDPALAEGMLAAQVIGQAGFVPSDRVRTGLFLIAPGVHYPLHTHGAEEIYYCLAGRIAVQHGRAGAPVELTPGRLSRTPPHRLHSLTTGAEPVLMLYVWIGDVDAPNWWWSEGTKGWERARWSRQSDGSWRLTGSEAVTAAALAEAGE